MQLRVGTSGFSYKEWRGSFYPKDIPDKQMLAYYAGRLNSVEINNTFYRLPNTRVLQSWAEQVGDDFRFIIKASQKITHHKRLQGADDETEYLLRTVRSLGMRLGGLLFQLPGNLRLDLARLGSFLKLLPAGVPCAFEFRHVSWHDQPVYDLLSQHDCALCASETDDEPLTAITATASWGYLRLRRENYSSEDLVAWLQRIRDQPWKSAHVFFKHEDAASGPLMAERFLQLAAT